MFYSQESIRLVLLILYGVRNRMYTEKTVRAYVTSVRGTHPVISSITFALFGAFGSMSPVSLPLLPADSLAAAPM